jgi:hypothetical protein
MSSEAPSRINSNPTNSRESKRQRQAGASTSPSEVSQEGAAVVTPRENLSPLQAAVAFVGIYVVTLHSDLAPFLQRAMENFLHDFAKFFWKDKKHQEMTADDSYIPRSCKINLSLNATEETRNSEGFTAIEARLAADRDAAQLKFASYAKEVHDLNRKSLWERTVKNFCLLLTTAARGFIAQCDIKNYGEHLAVMDLLALKADDVTATMNISLEAFLRMYKKAHNLVLLPVPTLPHDFQNVLGRINGPALSNAATIQVQGMAQGDPRNPAAANAANAQAATAVPAAAAPPPPMAGSQAAAVPEAALATALPG